MADEPKPVTTLELVAMKQRGERIVALTCYDALFARLLDASGVDVLLVGDSVNQVLAGAETTLSATLEQMIYHTKIVRRGAARALVVCDMPFLTYQVSREEAVRNCGRVMQETGCHAVKLEGGAPMAETVRALVEIGIPVMGHLGLTPQSVHALGGYRVQGRDEKTAELMDAVMWNRESIGGSFALTDQDGRPRSDADFRGKLMLVYFGFTYCPDVCPTDLQQMALAVDRGSAADELKLAERADEARDRRDEAVRERHHAHHDPERHPPLHHLDGADDEENEWRERLDDVEEPVDVLPVDVEVLAVQPHAHNLARRMEARDRHPHRPRGHQGSGHRALDGARAGQRARGCHGSRPQRLRRRPDLVRLRPGRSSRRAGSTNASTGRRLFS